jgi:hypothetical protein
MLIADETSKFKPGMQNVIESLSYRMHPYLELAVLAILLERIRQVFYDVKSATSGRFRNRKLPLYA